MVPSYYKTICLIDPGGIVCDIRFTNAEFIKTFYDIIPNFPTVGLRDYLRGLQCMHPPPRFQLKIGNNSIETQKWFIETHPEYFDSIIDLHEELKDYFTNHIMISKFGLIE